MTGLLGQQLDLPSFSWDMTVGDSSFTTTTKHEPGQDSMSGLQMPWAQVPGRSAYDRMAELAPYKRGIALFWSTGDGMGVPVLAGALGVRTSTRTDVQIPYISVLGLLKDRYLVHEGGFGTGTGHTSPGTWEFDGLSWRGLACEVVKACTSDKPGGALPLDLPYLGESGTHSLPADSADAGTASSNSKQSWRRNTSDGYVTTVIDGDRTTHTVVHVKESKKTVKVNHSYHYHTRKGTVTKTKTENKTIVTRRVTTTTKTVTVRKNGYQEVTTSTTTVTDDYNDAGVRTHETTTSTDPVVTRTPVKTRTVYKDFNISEHSCADILDKIAAADGGPDLQFRPYLAADGQHLRFRLEAGSDANIYLNQDRVLSLDSAPDGGTLENLSADWGAPYMRDYVTGAGTDKAMVCDLVQDLSLVNISGDPWPLREMTESDTDAASWEELSTYARGRLSANARPVVQFSGELHANDVDSAGNVLHPLGSFWPGELFDVAIEGYPDWPDGTYRMRLMEMSGDQTDKVKLKFDPVQVPTEGETGVLKLDMRDVLNNSTGAVENTYVTPTVSND